MCIICIYDVLYEHLHKCQTWIIFKKKTQLLTSWECQTCQGPAGCKAAEAQEKDVPEDTDVTGREKRVKQSNMVNPPVMLVVDSPGRGYDIHIYILCMYIYI